MKIVEIYDLFAQKIADVTHIPYPYILALRDNGLMNQKEARDKLIRYDYLQLQKTKKFTRNQIVEKLAGIYGVNKQTVLTIVKASSKCVFYCRKCGSAMPKTKYARNDGICDKCISKQIKM